jgi:hypothetical protein
MIGRMIRLFFLCLGLFLAFFLVIGSGVGAANCFYQSVTMNLDVPAASMTGRMHMEAGLMFVGGIVLAALCWCCVLGFRFLSKTIRTT